MRLSAGALAQAYVIGIILLPTALVVFAALVYGFGMAAIALGGAIPVVLLLGFSKANALHQSPTEASFEALAALAVLTAFAGTLIGGQLCAPAEERCGKVPPESDTTYDSDWHGWPIMWRTDMPSEWQHENNWDKSLVLTFGTSVSLPLFVLSLGVWFTMAVVGEAVVFGAWTAFRRFRPRPARSPLTGQ